MASPHTRGWTPESGHGTPGRCGFPAHAGMDPPTVRLVRRMRRLPRTRGDGPFTVDVAFTTSAASPHTRGWTSLTFVYDENRYGFPAHAGMDPARDDLGHADARLPRTRGDGPSLSRSVTDSRMASPHTRGWTDLAGALYDFDTGFPAHAGMDPFRRALSGSTLRLPRTRGDGPGKTAGVAAYIVASPHTRGWTHEAESLGDGVGGFPAHAGMDPALTKRARLPPGLPRTRGDGPCTRMIGSGSLVASPHTRGWTLPSAQELFGGEGFPAHAGMDPNQPTAYSHLLGLPRTRGDGPSTVSAAPARVGASPHTRGWTVGGRPPRRSRDGFPAHAGMDPRTRARCRCTRRLPRTRGDGPEVRIREGLNPVASPHTRGWTRRPLPRDDE